MHTEDVRILFRERRVRESNPALLLHLLQHFRKSPRVLDRTAFHETLRQRQGTAREYAKPFAPFLEREPFHRRVGDVDTRRWRREKLGHRKPARERAREAHARIIPHEKHQRHPHWQARLHQPTLVPGTTSTSGVRSAMPSGACVARSIPWLSTPRSMRGARFTM